MGIFVLLFFGILMCVAKSCKGHHTSSHKSQTEIKNPYQGQIDKQTREDERYHRCKYCHGKGTVLFSPNSWGGPGFCKECNKEVNGEHPHICNVCNGTGREVNNEKNTIQNTSQTKNNNPYQSLVRVTCKKCQGKGYFDLRNGNEHFQLTCPECNGLGIISL